MLRGASTILLLFVIVAAPANAQPTELMPGVTFDKTLEFTPHGAVVLDVITAPRPGDDAGLYALAPVLAGGAVGGGTAPLTELERSVSAQATVAGIDGDFAAPDGEPAGVVMQDGALLHSPAAGRSSIGIDAAGLMHVDRVRLFGTWQGTGQRRPLDGVNEPPLPGQTVLFTPAFGPAAPVAPGSADVVLGTLPAVVPGGVVTGAVAAAGSGGGEAIPPGGAVVVATGAAAAKLAAEAPLGTSVSIRLALQPDWTGVTEALGGGPVLVRAGKPVFRTTEDFTDDQVTSRSPRAAVGQLADGRVILVAVDGSQPGYSVGLTSFELAQTLVQLGAVRACGLASGSPVSSAFDGTLLDRPTVPGGAPLEEALLVEYFGVYAPPPPLALVTGEPGRTAELLQYKIVRPSKVTAQLVGPDGAVHVLEAGVQHDPGTYGFTYSTFDREGGWQWQVSATDDLGRTSTDTQSFRYDTTLRALVVPRAARSSLTVRFTLSRPATVKLQIETRGGVPIATLAPTLLAAGPQTLVWDGTLATHTRAFAGAYVAHLSFTSSVGTSDISAPFTFRVTQ
ncbi:MAG TPA: phosphodiester glycosidase family protein [Gaiellaceae bacterium]|nr:phosphodiester glycosidase family protein [Gaiellaceae bacterium]